MKRRRMRFPCLNAVNTRTTATSIASDSTRAETVCFFWLFLHFSCAEECQVVKPFSVFLFGKRKEPLLIERGQAVWCGMSFAQ